MRIEASVPRPIGISTADAPGSGGASRWTPPASGPPTMCTSSPSEGAAGPAGPRVPSTAPSSSGGKPSTMSSATATRPQWIWSTFEHVDNVPLYMKSCADLVAPGGLLFSATINRTLRALALAKVGAEYILNWLPRGTHDWNRFLTPEELGALITRNGLTLIDKAGVVFHPLAGEWRKSTDMGVNYMLLAERSRG